MVSLDHDWMLDPTVLLLLHQWRVLIGICVKCL